MATKKRFYTKKYMGDDLCSWAVFDRNTDRPVMTGLTGMSARFYRDKLEKGRSPKPNMEIKTF